MAKIDGESSKKFKKRIIFIGFKEPKTLERDLIYVTLEKEVDIKATAISDEEFKYPIRAMAGNILRNTTKKADNLEGGPEPYFIDYNKFIEELVLKNNGVVDYSRAIEEGSEAYRKIKSILR